jgi:hypothetical protein
MKQTLIAFAVAAGCAFAGAAGAAVTKEEYKAQMDKITADYKAANDSCKALKANAQDICKAEAKGKEKIAKAELEASNAPSPSADQKLRMAKADATDDIAKERCDDCPETPWTCVRRTPRPPSRQPSLTRRSAAARFDAQAAAA